MSDSEGGEGETESGESASVAVVLDHLPQGRPGDDRPQSQKPPIAYALGERAFNLYELTLAPDASVSVGDRVRIDGAADTSLVERIREIGYDDLSGNATAELEYAVEKIVTDNEERFVNFYNEAQPITLRLHQLNLLPGIGKKLRNSVLDERKRGPFETFADLEDRITGLHNPEDVLVERIMEELREEDLKYKTFVGRDPDA